MIRLSSEAEIFPGSLFYCVSLIIRLLSKLQLIFEEYEVTIHLVTRIMVMVCIVAVTLIQKKYMGMG